MERKLASIQKILKLEPIEGADSIEKATVLGWNLVVRKGEFQVGDLCVYFEVDSLLPMTPEFEFLAKSGSVKKMLINQKEVVGYRLKTIRLRGQISQGVALPISIFKQIEKHNGMLRQEVYEGQDVTDVLQVFKYEPPIPAQLAGKVKGMRPSFIPKTDETRIQAVPHILQRYQDTNFVVTEKLDGSSVSVYNNKGEFGVCSRNLELIEDENNTMWRVVNELQIKQKLQGLENEYQHGLNYALQGEIVGEGIQGNPLKIKGQKIYFYNVYDIDKGKYLSYPDFIGFIDQLGLDRVPMLMNKFTLYPDVDRFVEWVSSLKSLINPDVMPEGIVVRSWVEQQDEDLGRLSFKVINPLYLLKNED